MRVETLEPGNDTDTGRDKTRPRRRVGDIPAEAPFEVKPKTREPGLLRHEVRPYPHLVS